MADLSFRIVNLVSEGVYLHENCVTNPSRHVPGPKTAMKNLKMLILGSRGFRAEILYINSRSTALSGRYVNYGAAGGAPGGAGGFRV